MNRLDTNMKNFEALSLEEQYNRMMKKQNHLINDITKTFGPKFNSLKIVTTNYVPNPFGNELDRLGDCETRLHTKIFIDNYVITVLWSPRVSLGALCGRWDISAYRIHELFKESCAQRGECKNKDVIEFIKTLTYSTN